MRSQEEFDAFYARERAQLLLETYALTGDLPASRTAVRDAFSATWHHWRKVSRLEDPAAWTRPLAHSRAQRRHTARIWHREQVDEDTAATLDALSGLSAHQRKMLVLTHLTPLPMSDIARAVGIPREEAERDLQNAATAFALHRDIATTSIRGDLERLRAATGEARWPRATIVRRAGTARRRTHTVIGVGAAVAAMLLSGTLVTSGGATPVSLHEEDQVRAAPRPAARPAPPRLEESRLLEARQLDRQAPRLRWQVASTSTNLAGDGLALPCQEARFADTRGLGALLRTYRGTTTEVRTKKVRGKPGRTRRTKVRVPRAEGAELVELSRSQRAARKAYATSRQWYAGCEEDRVRLISTHRVTGVGQAADLFVLESWGRQPGIITVGLARTGRLTVTTVARAEDGDTRPGTAARTLSAAVNALCGGDGATVCAGPPSTREVAPLPTGSAPGMLAALDLPPVPAARGPWVGTPPARARDNAAATRCDDTQFTGPGISRNLTRTFLFPAQPNASEFGITQTVGAMDERAARQFVDGVRRRIAACAEADLGTTVDNVLRQSSRDTDLTVWDLDVEISDRRSVEFLMAILREGTAVSQIGFVPGGGLDLGREQFLSVTRRALERLDRLPAPSTRRR